MVNWTIQILLAVMAGASSDFGLLDRVTCKTALTQRAKRFYGWLAGIPDSRLLSYPTAPLDLCRALVRRHHNGGYENPVLGFGFKYDNPDKPYDMEGFVNSAGAVTGLEYHKALYDCCTPPGSSNSYMGEGVDAFKSGQGALQMNFACTWPGFYTDANVGGDVTGYFANPAGPNSDKFAQWGGQRISVVAVSDKQDAALTHISWFAQSEVQAKWWKVGGYSALRAVVEDPGFATSQPYAQTVLDSLAIVKDFWAEPSYATLLQTLQK